MFGAWQAGAWRTLAPTFKPDLIVGASVGSLNGYALASGWTADELCHWWQQPGVARFEHLPEIVRRLIAARPRELEFAVVLTDVLRLKPRAITGAIHAEHLLASCAVPLAARPRRIDGRWYFDGGLLNPLPIWAAVELGATRIVALNALPEFPSSILRPFAKAFRLCFGYHPRLPPGVELTTLVPQRPLGSLRDALSWTPQNAARWIAQGAADAATAIY
ncbi:MAG: patatin-like phospholipase family protein [Acidobacteriota bacterium]|nr:patatin-like phospholipase family protein [Acidobacteriota bacterium]